jgi:hypothetical protein
MSVLNSSCPAESCPTVSGSQPVGTWCSVIVVFLCWEPARSAASFGPPRVREAVVWQGIQMSLAAIWHRTSRSIRFVFRVIGFRASDAVVMAGLRDLISRRGGRASAAAPMAGDCE